MYNKWSFKDPQFEKKYKELRKDNRDLPTLSDLYKVMNYRLATKI